MGLATALIGQTQPMVPVRIVPIYRVGVLTDNYPYSFRDGDGRISGFAYDLVREIEKVMNLRMDRVTGTNTEIRVGFQQRRIDILQSWADFPERAADYDFSVPYLTMSGAIVVRSAERDIRSIADLNGRKVLVHAGSLGETVLKRAGLEASIMPAESVEQALIRLNRGEGDATMVSRLTGLAVAHRLGLRNVRSLDAEVAGYRVRYCFAVHKGNAELLARLNEGLAILVRTGRFDEIYTKWFGHIEPRGFSTTQVLAAVAAGLALALGVAVWAAAKQRTLRGQLLLQAEALRVSEERYRGVFEGARDGLIVLGRGPDDFVVEQLNPAAGRLLAAGPEASKLGVLLAEDPTLAARLRSSANAGRTEEFELQCVDGNWLRIGVNPLGARVLVALSDITEQKRAAVRLQQQEEQLRQKQKLEAVGTLAGGVAHDFNNLLTSILGNTELALIALPKDHPEVAGLAQSLRAARRARDLVRQILAFSRQAAPSREVVAIEPLVDETINLLRTLARGAVEFNVRLPADLPAVLADPVQVHQVLMNIGTNAVQAMRGAPGRLDFRASVVELGVQLSSQWPEVRPGSYICISIQDTGPGMPVEVQQRIFEPFFTTKPPGEGTGLGLSVVHGIMQQHSGAVTLQSQPGQGTLFQLYFRTASRSLPGVGSTPPVPVPEGRGEKVLLVDDDPAIVETAAKMLRQIGYTVSAHCRADEALKEWTAAPEAFAVIVSDLTMPGMNGLQLLARVHALRPAQGFVLISGFFSESESAEAASLGVAALLPKPLSIGSLGRAVAAGLART